MADHGLGSVPGSGLVPWSVPGSATPEKYEEKDEDEDENKNQEKDVDEVKNKDKRKEIYSGSSIRLRRCAFGDCSKREAIPKSFKVCEKCQRNEGKTRPKLPKSYFCSEKCFETEWKLRHRRFHKEEREMLQEEEEKEKEEEDSVSKISFRDSHSATYEVD